MSGLLLAAAFDGREVRVVGTAERPEFVAQDVCDALGIKSARSTLRNFSPQQKGVHAMHTPGGEQELLTVTEPGLYRLIFKSTRPEAERFQAWVFEEVLPALRRSGSYTVRRHGMILVDEGAWREQSLAITALSEAYELQAAAASKFASLAASILAMRRHSRPKRDPRQALIAFGEEGEGGAPALAEGETGGAA